MRNFCKFTVKSPAASYIPLPRFLLQDEQLRDISNDAKVLSWRLPCMASSLQGVRITPNIIISYKKKVLRDV